MPVTVIVGSQWGDEGKGKAIDYFARDADFVARYNGGNNAGHTVINELGTFKIHLVPSGIFYPHTTCLMGNGMVIDPQVLLGEMREIRDAGVNFEKRLLIAQRAHLIMPYHKMLDGLYEEAKGAGATGTTRRGIGPAFADKISYNGLRWADFVGGTFDERLWVQLGLKNKIITALGGAALDYEEVRKTYWDYYAQLKPYITELAPIVHKGLEQNKKFLLEQAMGSLLDTDWGVYPFVTASSTLASAATTGLGIPPRKITRIIGVTKAYSTRVGGGPMPTELPDGHPARAQFGETAATTGRRRRAGWLDLAPVQFTARLNGMDALFVTKLDTLSGLDELKICVAYKLDGKTVPFSVLESTGMGRAAPVYRSFRGWTQNLTEIRKFQDLPKPAIKYIEAIENVVGVPVRYIGVGPERHQVIKK
ncbi:MAG: adenylosuccinate synthase [Anaerolineae bacterium]|nr:adenylosuccinate synthase [Anaerolineae bacterium]